MIRPRFHTRSKPPSKATQERRARWLLLNTRSLGLVPPEQLARTTGLPLKKAQAMWDAEADRRGKVGQ